LKNLNEEINVEVGNFTKKKLSLKNDIVFKELFSKDEEFLKNFLSSLLNESITKIEILKDAALSKINVYDKLGILDIKATINGSTVIDIEMQRINKNDIMPRTTTYSTKLSSSLLKSGQGYKSLKNVIIIAILDFDIFPYEEYVSESVLVLDKHRKHELNKYQKYYYIELPKFEKQMKKNNNQFKSDVERWLTLIVGESKEGVEKAMSENKVIKKVKKELEYLTGDEEIARLEELREKGIRELASAKRCGYDIGVESGIKKGKTDIIKSMLKKSLILI